LKEKVMLRKLTITMTAAAALLMPMSAIAAHKTGGGHSTGHSYSGKIGTSSGVKSFQSGKHYTRHEGTQNRTKYVGTQSHTKYVGTKNYTKHVGTKSYTKHVVSKHGHRHYSHRRHFYHGIMVELWDWVLLGI
jgi:hypothetical protein